MPRNRRTLSKNKENLQREKHVDTGCLAAGKRKFHPKELTRTKTCCKKRGFKNASRTRRNKEDAT